MSNRIFLLFAGIALVLLSAQGAGAQVVSLYDVIHRPAGETWLVVHDGPHTIIFPPRRELQARETLDILKRTKPATNAFLGVDRDFPLTAVLSDQSDAGNGYVTPFPFKTEIEAAALRGRGLSRKHHSWVEIVTTHELVHAAQAEFRINKSLTGVARRFSPDFARALGLFQPSGFVEGLAVFRESQVPDGAGRLNHSFFTMQARAGMSDGNGWSLAQALEQPSYTRPFDRFYKGGALFTEFLIQSYGEESVRASLRWQQQLPFAGFGSNLRLALDRSPSRLEEEFHNWFAAREDSVTASIGTLSPERIRVSKRGQSHRRPYWLSNQDAVAFTLGYDLARGFFRTGPDGTAVRLSRNEISDDATFFLTPDASTILYSRYSEHPTSPQVQTAWSYQVSVSNGLERVIPGSERTTNPVMLADGRILALRSEGQFNRIVELTSEGRQETVFQRPSLEVVSMAPRPGSDSLAVVAKSGPHQALFLIDTSAEDWTLTPWIGFSGSTVYDAAWDASGRYLSFTSDWTGILNVYVLDARTETLTRATNALYAAMEGQVSPDGSRLIYVSYDQEQFNLVERTLESPGMTVVNRDKANDTWGTSWEADAAGEEDYKGLDQAFSEARPYRAWRHLKPRMLYPVAYLDNPRERDNDARLGLGLGLAMQGTDPLQRLAWYGEGMVQRNRLWGEFGVQSGRYAFRPGVKMERRPTTVDAFIQSQSNLQRVIRDRTSWSITTLLPYTIDSNVHRTSFNTSVSLSYRADRFLDDDLAVLQSRRSRLALEPALYFGRRIVRNPRDLWPTSGQSVTWFGDVELNRDVGEKRRGSVTLLNVYVPLLQRTNTSIRLDGGHLHQNAAGIFGLRYIKPTGYEDAPVGDDSWIRLGARILQPVAFPDNGWLTIPAFLRAVYVRAGLETIMRLDDTGERYSSVSAGLGIKARLWHVFDFDLSWQAAYRMQSGDWDTVWESVSEN